MIVDKNKYGYFEYEAVAVGAKDEVVLSTNVNLQQNASLAQLKAGVDYYDYASLEYDEYYTENPKEMVLTNTKLGFLTQGISNSNGNFQTAPKITCTFINNYSVDGITIDSINLLRDVDIAYYHNNTLIVQKNYKYINQYSHFYEISGAVGFNKIIITVNQILEEGHFLGITRITYGRKIVFEEDKIVSSAENNYYELKGDTLQYGTLDLQVLYDNPVTFQKMQRLIKKDNSGEVLDVYYLDNARKDKNTNIITFSAYDVVYMLESEYDGGYFDNVKIQDINDYMFLNSGINVGYADADIRDIRMTGFLPQESRRKGLMRLCLGAGIRVRKVSGNLVFDNIPNIPTAVIQEQNIVEGSLNISFLNSIYSLTLQQHNYDKSNETADFYNWYLTPNVDIHQRVNFDKTIPMWQYNVYAVINEGADNESEVPINTLISTDQSLFEDYNTSFIIIKRFSTGTYGSNKIIIHAKKMIDRIVEYRKQKAYSIVNETYDDIIIEDATIIKTGGANALANQLYDIYSHDIAISFSTINNYELGQKVRIVINGIDVQLIVTKITDTLCGLYDVEVS